MTGINTYKKNRRGGESAKGFYVEPRPSARHSASLMLSSRARRRSQRGAAGARVGPQANEVLLVTCSYALFQRPNSGKSCAQMCVRQVHE